MSLTGSQRRKLNLIEGDLRESSPKLVSMFGIFTRLNGAEGPAVTERLRPFRLRAGVKRLSAFALIPVAIGMVVAGVVLGGTGRGTGHVQPPTRVTWFMVPGR